MTTPAPILPDAPRSILKGSSLKGLLDDRAVAVLGENLRLVWPKFPVAAFQADALAGLEPLGLMSRGPHIARALRAHLPPRYREAVEILLASLTPPKGRIDGLGLAVFFYHPHTSFVALYGHDPEHNGGDDPFEVSMLAQHALTQRFTAEFSIRSFLQRDPARTLARLMQWTSDPDEDVRRLCSEGTRSRLPWGSRLQAFVADPSPVLPILEALKDDPALYVRRSVANHLGDIAKDHRELALSIAERWLAGASAERRWVIRHALRHPAKKGVDAALRLRRAAK